MAAQPDPPDAYLIGHLQEALATDPRVAEQGLDVHVAGGTVVITGQVATTERRNAVSVVAAELLPDHRLRNQVVVTPLDPPAAAEELS